MNTPAIRRPPMLLQWSLILDEGFHSSRKKERKKEINNTSWQKIYLFHTSSTSFDMRTFSMFLVYVQIALFFMSILRL